MRVRRTVSACLLFGSGFTCVAVAAGNAGREGSRAPTPLSFGADVWSVQFSRDGKTLVALSTDPPTGSGRATLRDADHGQVLRVLEPLDCAWQWMPPGRSVVAIGRIHDLGTALPKHQLTIDFWDLERGRLLRQRHSPPIAGGPLAFSEDGRIVATDGGPEGERLLDTLTGRLIHSFRSEYAFDHLTYSAHRKAIAAASGDRVGVWSFLDWRPIRRLQMPDEVQDLAFSPHGRLLAARTHYGEVWLWNTRTWRRVARLRWMGGPAGDMAFSPDGRLLADSVDRTVYVWGLRLHRNIARLPAITFVESVTFSPDSHSLAAGDLDGRVYDWSLGPHGWVSKWTQEPDRAQ